MNDDLKTMYCLMMLPEDHVLLDERVPEDPVLLEEIT
jgi:hypothetical protein